MSLWVSRAKNWEEKLEGEKRSKIGTHKDKPEPIIFFTVLTPWQCSWWEGSERWENLKHCPLDPLIKTRRKQNHTEWFNLNSWLGDLGGFLGNHTIVFWSMCSPTLLENSFIYLLISTQISNTFAFGSYFTEKIEAIDRKLPQIYHHIHSLIQPVFLWSLPSYTVILRLEPPF